MKKPKKSSRDDVFNMIIFDACREEDGKFLLSFGFTNGGSTPTAWTGYATVGSEVLPLFLESMHELTRDSENRLSIKRSVT
jgi:hypothetical protein